jgi:DNA-binding NarL/FixJ family response regulator
MIRIVIIDHYQPDLNRVCDLLAAQRDLKVVGLARDGYEALKVVDALKPDILIMDTRSPHAGETEFPFLLKRKSPSSAIIIFTSPGQEERSLGALGSVVSGYLLKDTDLGRLTITVRRVFEGGFRLTPGFTSRVSPVAGNPSGGETASPDRSWRIALPAGISRSEFLVLGFLAQGRSNKEIAERLCLKYGTVRNYVSSALKKAGLRNRTQMAIFTLKQGLRGRVPPLFGPPLGDR